MTKQDAALRRLIFWLIAIAAGMVVAALALYGLCH